MDNMDTLTRSQRLDRLPFTRKHAKLLGVSGIGWALDAMDVGLISFIMAVLAVQWNLDKSTLSVLGSIGFVGMAIGASLGGLLADKFGRRQVFALTLLIYGFATGASALATSVGVLIVLRFFVGLGLGAELPVASTLISEYAPQKIRGRVVVGLEAFWALGWILAALISYYLIPLSDSGWRIALALGCIPTLYSVVVRWGLPESVRFLEKKGRYAEAEAAVRSFEASAGVLPPASTPASAKPPAPQRSRDSIWSAQFRGRTGALWAVWFGINFSYYGAFIWIPSLLVGQGFSLVKSFEFTLIMTLFQLPGYAVAAWSIEKLGRRFTLVIFLAGSAFAALGFGLASGQLQIITMGCLLSFFNLGAWGALYATSPEVYPTGLRGTGSGAAAAFGRVASILAPLSVPVLLKIGGENGEFLVFCVLATAFLGAALASLALPEMRGQKLED